MMYPQEVEVWYIIPALKRKIARCLVRKYKLSQKKTSDLLELTEGAVSQYINNKRAKDIHLGCELAKDVEKSAGLIQEEKSNINIEIQKLLKLCYKKGVLCKIHKQHQKLPEKCNFCNVLYGGKK